VSSVGDCHCNHPLFPFLEPVSSGPTSPVSQHPLYPLSEATAIGGKLPLRAMSARQQHLRLARGSADSVCLRDGRYLHTHTRAGRGGRRSKEIGGPVDLFVCVYVMYICVCV